MNENQQAAYVMAQAACVMAVVHGMLAENQSLFRAGEPLKYTETDFIRVIEDHGITHNQVLSFFRGV